MNAPAKFVGTAEINGKAVSFFTPPHDEPDFLWVNIEELAKAFLPRAAARKMFKLSQNFETENRLTRHDGKVVTIACHAMAQGLCGAIDQSVHNYVKREEWGGGPSETAYSIAAGKMMAEHHPLPFSQLAKAFHNQGGPFMRDFRGEASR